MTAVASIGTLRSQFSGMTLTGSEVSSVSGKKSMQSRQIVVAAKKPAVPASLLTLPDVLFAKIFSYTQTVTTLCIGKPPVNSEMDSLLRTCRHFTSYREAIQEAFRYPIRHSAWSAIADCITALDFRHLFVTKETNADWIIPSSSQVRKLYLPSLCRIDEAVVKKLDAIKALTSLDLTQADTTNLTQLPNLTSIQEVTFKLCFPVKPDYEVLDPKAGTLQKIDRRTMVSTRFQGKRIPLFPFTQDSFFALSQMPNLRSLHWDCRDSSEQIDGYNEFLVQLGRLTTLTELTLTGFCSMVQLKQISHIASLYKLQKLTLSPDDLLTFMNGEPFSRKFIFNRRESIAFAHAITIQFQKIEELRLSQFAFSDESIAYLSRLKNLRILTLELDPAATTQGIQEISRLTSLQELHLIPRSIQQLKDVLSAIQDLPAFERLELDYFGLPSNKVLELVQKFKNEHGRCRVFIQNCESQHSTQYREIEVETSKKLKSQRASTTCIVM